MKPVRKNARAFATTVAIILIGLVGAALAGLSLRLAADARRTAREAAEAQQRQWDYAASIKANKQ